MSTKKRYIRLKYAGTSARAKLRGSENCIELKFNADNKTIVRVELDTWQWRELANEVEEVGKAIADELKQRAARIQIDTARHQPPF